MSAIRQVTVPDIGDFKDIPIIDVLVKVGDRVAKDTPLVVLESDKATLEVPSPEAGTIRELQVAIGARVSEGSLLLELDGVSQDTEPLQAAGAARASILELSARSAAPSVLATASVQPSTVSDRPPLHAVNGLPFVPILRMPHASPSIRRMARELGVDLAAVTGTGPRGRIVREDLQRFVRNVMAAPTTHAGGDSLGGITLAPWPQVDFSKIGHIDRAPLPKIRKLSGASLARNAVVIPHVTNFEDADITDLEALRRTLNAQASPADPKVTLLSFLIKATAATLAKYRQFNSSLDGDELVLKSYFHIGFAADTSNGLVVPVIRDVDTKSITQIAVEAADLAARARDGKLKPTDMQGGCFTISSLGGVGSTGFTPIINAPEVAILGVTRAQMRPVWNGKEFQPRLILPLILSWDHRVVDGVAAARFLVHLSGLLNDLRKILL
jgi:pyruvate dehydrogenase E2 component (dihydrolipoamide acetyltransferase)